jgi:hypothetical protein
MVKKTGMSLNVSELAGRMLGAAQEALSAKWPEIKDYAEGETQKLAQSLVTIEKLHLSGQITEEQARLHLDIQKNASRTVLLTVEGLGLLAVEQAINAALRVVKDTVNTALGFVLV